MSDAALKNMGCISVIVPVYKVEPYLDRCVQSIVDQIYTDLEIILVDDGSPDSCPAMCDAWAEKDDRIRVIHKENGGLSDARNAGIAVAAGEYISFVDSDDWIAPEMLQRLQERMAATESDIVSCDALRVWDDGTPSKSMIREKGEYVLNRTESMQALIESTCQIQTVWNKLYKADLVKQVPFEKGKIHEDEFWSWKVFSLSCRVATVKEAYYYYSQRADSIMGDGYTAFPMLVVEAKLERHDYIIREMPELEDIDSYNLLTTCFYQGVQILKHEPKARRDEYFSELKNAVEACQFSKRYLSKIKLSKRFRLYLIKYHFLITCLAAVLRGIE